MRRPGAVEHNAAQDQIQFPQRLHVPFGHQLALPHDNHVPASCLQQRLVAGIPLTVARNLLPPELGIRRRAVLLAFMTVPEAAVHKYHRPPLPHHDVRSSRQRFHIQPVAVALPPQPPSHHQLRLGVASPDAAHATMPLLPCHPIRHNNVMVLITAIVTAKLMIKLELYFRFLCFSDAISGKCCIFTLRKIMKKS